MDPSIDIGAAFAARPIDSSRDVVVDTDYTDAPLRGINVNTDGEYAFEFPDGTTGTYTLASGVIHPIVAVKVTAAAGDVKAGK
jgi:hypothetical protein